jgi:phosphomevalonate kinase
MTEVNGVPIGDNFLNFDTKVTDCAKTGMGSSSGVMVILIKAIFYLFFQDEDMFKKNMKIVHMLAQYCNYRV